MRAREQARLGKRQTSLGRRDGALPVVALVTDAAREGPGRLAALAGSAVVAGVAPVVVAILSGALLATARGVNAQRFRLDAAYGLLGVAVGVMLAGQAATALRLHLGEDMGRRLSGTMLGRAMEAAASMSTIDRLWSSEVADRLARVRGLGTIEVLPGDGLVAMANMASVWSGNLAAAILLTSLRWWLGLGAAAVLAGSYLAIRRGYRAIVLGSQNEAGSLRRAAYLRDVLLTPGAAKEVRLFALTDYFVDGFLSSWNETVRHLRAARAESEWVCYVLSLGVAAVYLATLGVLGAMVARGRLGADRLAEAALALGPLTAGILPGRDDLNIGWGAQSARAVRQLEAMAPTSAPPITLPGDGAAHLQCQGLSFAYGTGRPVFEGLDLELRPGQSVAVVGENGAGKTTLAMLLAGLLVPSAGQILIDGQTLGDPRAWQRQVAVLFQDFVRYHGATIADNVAFGAIEHQADWPSRDSAAARAGLDTVLSGLEAGWDSLIGPEYPGGIDLSGGQWQRVALARALFALAHGARLLVLDEPAASLDVAAETELYDRFLELTAGVTTIVVSHRLAAVRHAARIVVLEAGRVVEDGSHDELMALGGRYRDMFILQARRFGQVQR